ncbi:hypothetical protein L6452_44104 [Arctium lappa]|uniref:Uncharacterized protein n=1 Tax=Arctium lappa TaxID=4217 RepID=A0ACB8XEV1_ARCLA|nr:hypothetical protein L6452_44104 [Arctium lappa]
MAADPEFANGWITSNVLPYYPASKIILINFDNEDDDQNTKLQQLSVMQNLQNAIDGSSLGGKIKVSTVHSMTVLARARPTTDNWGFVEEVFGVYHTKSEIDLGSDF